MTSEVHSKQITFLDGYSVHARLWQPPNPRSRILYLHGIQSHGGWYELSGGARRCRLHRPHARPPRLRPGTPTPQPPDSLDQCLADTKCMLDFLLKMPGGDAAGRPSAHVIGVSWGGKQAVHLAQAHPRHVKTLSLIAPGLFPRIDLTLTEKFRVGVSMINDREKLFDIPLNDAAFFTDNPERMAFVERDMHKLQQVSARFLLTSRQLDKLIRVFPDSPYRNPVHLFLAGRDRIIDNEKTRDWLRGLPSPDRRITEYPDGGHTLEFDRDPEPFLNDLVTWISERA
ncbi:MAG: alpha/beta fold hydrolase [Planctomycetes bacterium]|nr:alpha/beta fold hydrolase [Planctomycetota bacterium]